MGRGRQLRRAGLVAIACVASLWVGPAWAQDEEGAKAPAREGAPELAPVPSAAEQKAAEDRIKTAYKTEYAKPGAEDRWALARMLIEQAKQTDEPVARYVMLRETRDMAAVLGDGELACQAIDRLAQEFQVPRVEQRIEALFKAVNSTRDQQALKRTAHVALAMADDAVAADDFALLQRLDPVISGAMTRTRDPVLKANLQAHAKEKAAIRLEYVRLKDSLEKFKANPDDGEANLMLGRYHALIKSDWGTALPMLAKASDATIRDLATQDLSNPQSTDAIMKLADGYWGLSARTSPTFPESLAARFKDRARVWYGRALPDLKGLLRTETQKRLASPSAMTFGDSVFERGLVMEIFSDLEMTQRVRVDLAKRMTFDWNWRTPLPKGDPRHIYAIRYTGVLRNPETGWYFISVACRGWATVVVDGDLVVSGSEGTSTASVYLVKGVSSITVNYYKPWDVRGRLSVFRQPTRTAKNMLPQHDDGDLVLDADAFHDMSAALPPPNKKAAATDRPNRR